MAALAIALALAGCGGSDSERAGADSIAAPGAADIAAAPCARCSSGRVSGVAATGGAAIGGAEVRIFDAGGREVRTVTDAEGRFDAALGALVGAVIAEVTGQVAGQPTRLHGALRASEVGRRYLAVTPISEWIVADALGGNPETLAQADRLDFNRLAGAALTQSGERAAARLAPVLTAAGVGAEIDLRTALFDAPLVASASAAAGASGEAALPRALAWLQVDAVPGEYRVRHAAMAAGQSVRFVPAGGDGGTALPALDNAAVVRLREALVRMAAVEARLSGLGSAFSGSELPAPAVLAAHLTPGFRHGGLDRDTYVERVLRRVDAPGVGGYSLAGARFDSARLSAVDGDGRLRVRFALAPRAPFAGSAGIGWFEPASDGVRFAGDGGAHVARLAWALVLGPKPLPATELRARSDVACSPVASTTLPFEWCESSAVAIAPDAVFDYGDPQDARFGLFGLFRPSPATDNGEPRQRRAAFARHSSLLATPSARVQRFVVIEVDARAIDPRARSLRVSAPVVANTPIAQPRLAWTLHRPATDAGAPRFEHWTFDPDGREDWHAVEPGRCEGTPLSAAGPVACAVAWDAALAGGDWQVQVLDDQGQPIADGALALPPTAPDTERAWTARHERFARWDLGSRPDLQPTLARVNGLMSTDDDGLAFTAPWSPPTGANVMPRRVVVEWQRAPLDGSGPAETVRRSIALGAGSAAANVVVVIAARQGWVGTWLAARLEATDSAGNRFWHVVSPTNPH